MNFINVDTGGSFDWYILADPTIGFSEASAYSMTVVLAEVKHVFDHLFGAHIVNLRSPLITLRSSESYPYTDRRKHIIYLDTSGFFHMQQIFQFSHEFLHFMIPENVCSQYRWLEETFCSMMSWYTLQKIYDYSENRGLTQLQNMYLDMPGYILRDMAKRRSLNGITVSQFIYNNLHMLQKNCYDRLSNSAIGYEIYHLFLQFPDLWRLAPYMHLAKPDERLPHVIETLGSTAAISPIALNKLSALLCQQ